MMEVGRMNIGVAGRTCQARRNLGQPRWQLKAWGVGIWLAAP
ncbi:hypothetical protein SAMN05519103_02319 [Rhizobiales bacterium GAS113]|nr:hypothetical protein SAMN05519103_02319 [Rhizobiales bacterium GAS113]